MITYEPTGDRYAFRPRRRVIFRIRLIAARQWRGDWEAGRNVPLQDTRHGNRYPVAGPLDGTPRGHLCVQGGITGREGARAEGGSDEKVRTHERVHMYTHA